MAGVATVNMMTMTDAFLLHNEGVTEHIVREPCRSMLAEVECLSIEPPVRGVMNRCALPHQLPPQLLGLAQRHDTISSTFNDPVCQLKRQLRHLVQPENHIAPPVFLLRRHVRGRWNAQVWIYEEKCKDLAMAWSAGVLELEWLHAVLQHVWEGDDSALLSPDVAQILYRISVVLHAVQEVEVHEVVLVIVALLEMAGRNALAESEVAVCDVVAVVVVNRAGTNVFVEGAFDVPENAASTRCLACR